MANRHNGSLGWADFHIVSAFRLWYTAFEMLPRQKVILLIVHFARQGQRRRYYYKVDNVMCPRIVTRKNGHGNGRKTDKGIT